jgi:hypothetical protein
MKKHFAKIMEIPFFPKFRNLCYSLDFRKGRQHCFLQADGGTSGLLQTASGLSHLHDAAGQAQIYKFG